jgi:hypothetical protein
MATGDEFEVLRVDSEDAAVLLLQRALDNAYAGEAVKLDFEAWPTIRLRYAGDKFKGTITSDIAQAIVDLQDALNRSYSLAVNHTSSLRALSDEERRTLQVEATVEEGSSLIEINLGNWAESFSTALVGKMDGTEIVVTVLGSAVVFTAGWLLKHQLKNRSEEKKLELENSQRLALSQEETRRLAVVTQAMKTSAVVRETQVFAEGARDSMLKSAFDAEAFTIQGDLTISGEEARKTYRSKRREPLEVQLNGNYSIKSFAWSEDLQSARVRVQREGDQMEFAADLSVLSLSAEQRTRFKDATFEHGRVYLQVNATVLSDQITTAKIISVDEQPPAHAAAPDPTD